MCMVLMFYMPHVRLVLSDGISSSQTLSMPHLISNSQTVALLPRRFYTMR